VLILQSIASILPLHPATASAFVYSQTMCNRVVQKGRVIKPGERMTVLLKGPGAEFELPLDDAVFGGPAKSESRNYWIQREGAEDVLIPDVTRYGEKNQVTGEQGWEDLPTVSALKGFLLPQPPGKDYRLLKVLTQPATPEQAARLGNDRAPVVLPPPAPAK
jgi:hypothetical protein